ncbi:MAG: hypothetical protein QXS00_01175 [Pyrobaculum sp.]|uniref:hypothetical protein n=1 Tax=Pyrobaculum sp. TaxID=2004705 RepID=UPI0031699CD3
MASLGGRGGLIREIGVGSDMVEAYNYTYRERLQFEKLIIESCKRRPQHKVGQRGFECILRGENRGEFGKAQRGEKVTPSPCGSSLWECL